MDAPLHFHLAACLRVLGNFLCSHSVSIEEARIWIRRLSMVHSGPAEQRLVDDLEQVTGVMIADLAQFSENWHARVHH